MLGFFLGILKWLGILLLVILGLVLAVLLAVLIVPIRYEAEGSFKGEPAAKGRVSWLWRLFSCQVVYDGEAEVSLRIFGVKTGRKKEAADGAEEAEIPEPVVTAREKHPEKEEPAGGNKPAEEEPAGSNKPAEEAPVSGSQPGEECPAPEMPETCERTSAEKLESDAAKAAPEQPGAETETGKKRQKKKRIRQNPFQKIKVTFQRICGKLKTAEEKWQKLRDFLEKEENKNTFRLLKRQVIRLFRHILPGKVSGKVRFGFEDPYTTGRILTYISPFYGWYGRKIQVIPVFDEQVLEGEISLKGRIRIATLLFIGFQVWRDKNFRTLLKRWKAA